MRYGTANVSKARTIKPHETNTYARIGGGCGAEARGRPSTSEIQRSVSCSYIVVIIIVVTTGDPHSTVKSS